jgi:hypothetical protein
MAADLKQKFDTTFNIMTTDLNSLAQSTTVGRVAAEVDNTTNLYDDVIITAQIVFSTGTPTGVFEIYALGSNDGTIYSGDTSYSGTGAGYTIGSAGKMQNFAFLGAVDPVAASATRQGGFALSTAFGGRIPAFWSLFVLVNTGATSLASSGSTITGRGLWYQSV